MKRVRGFTTIELLIAVGILGLLVTVGIAGYQHMVNKSHQSAAKATLAGLYSAMKSYWADNGYYTSKLEAVGFLPDGPMDYYIGFSNNHCAAQDIYCNRFVASTNCFNTSPNPGGGASTCPAAWNLAAQYTIRAQAAGNFPPALDQVTDTSFIAGAVGHLDLTSAVIDSWSVDQFKTLKNGTPGF